MTKVSIEFGVRGEQPGDPNYPHSAGGVINFVFQVDGEISTRSGAEAAFGFARPQFLAWLKERGISCKDQVLPRGADGFRPDWIPTCYLDNPKAIEINGVRI